VDAAARRVLEAAGFGPDYRLPGLPHRTGHGIGLDIREWTYLVRGNARPLAAGMCFSNEPMICIEGEFGVRLEDHFYMTEQGTEVVHRTKCIDRLTFRHINCLTAKTGTGRFLHFSLINAGTDRRKRIF
jgi:Xaa-Pro aminopeptidase